MKVLVCGGRDFADRSLLFGTLDALLLEHTALRCDAVDFQIVHGAARGADALAGEWAANNDISAEAYPADWKKHGRAAGPIRNRKMLEFSEPDLVVAFPGGRGTADMVRRAELAAVPVLLVPASSPDTHSPTEKKSGADSRS